VCSFAAFAPPHVSIESNVFNCGAVPFDDPSGSSDEQMRCAFLQVLKIQPREYRKRVSSSATDEGLKAGASWRRSLRGGR
jgi:hypothetical protein